MNKSLQYNYDLIFSFFKTTTEPYDELEWDGNTLNVWLDDKKVEQYTLYELKELIYNLKLVNYYFYNLTLML